MTPGIQELKSRWQAAPGDKAAFWRYLTGVAERGDVQAVFDAVQAYQAHQPVDALLLTYLGHFLLKMGQPALALKFFRQAVQADASDTAALAGLLRAARAHGDRETGEQAMAQIERVAAPTASLLCEAGLFRQRFPQPGVRPKDIFEQALTVDPDHVPSLEALAHIETNTGKDTAGDSDAAQPYYDRALALAPDHAQLHLNYALYKLRRAELAEGWHHYEYRLDPALGQSKVAHYHPRFPGWSGEPLAGRRVLVLPEQGIGDEVMFGMHLPRLMREAEQVIIGCDPRLAEPCCRAFPSARVEGFVDRLEGGARLRSFPRIERDFDAGALAIDHAVHAGSLSRLYWGEAPPPVWPCGYLGAAPDRAAEMAEKLGPRRRRLRVGVSWRSAKTERQGHPAYLSDEELGALLSLLSDCELVSLQYGEVADTLASLESGGWPAMRVLETVDLKTDIEANLALLDQLDAVIGPATATQMFALALGKPTWIFGSGVPFWLFGARERAPRHIPGLRYFRFNPRDRRETLAAMTADLAEAVHRP